MLNWTKNVTKPIELAFKRANKRAARDLWFHLKRQDLDITEKRRLIKDEMEAPTSIRSFAESPPGWCIVDMDFKTAEVVQLGYTSGDTNLIGVLTEKDTQFARIDPNNPKKAVRIAFNALSAYPESAWDETLVKQDDPRILRDDAGAILHPLRDLHWEMAETVLNGPREKLDERLARDGVGKVSNFSIPYGSQGPLLERMVETNSGKKPEEGTGDKMRETYASRYPVAWRFLERMEARVEDPGWYRSTSGRVRHFAYTQVVTLDGLSDYYRKGILSPLQRQARNFPIQEGVAATAQRALERFLAERRKQGLRSRMMCLLYDALSALSPLEEARQTAELLKHCMTDWTRWENHGRTWNHDVDVSFAIRWGCKPNSEEKKLLAQHT